MYVRRRHTKKEAEEMNITAFMNLMVILVPFLLITAVFSKIASTETIGGEVVNYANSYNSFLELFYLMLKVGLGFGVLLLIVSPFLASFTGRRSAVLFVLIFLAPLMRFCVAELPSSLLFPSTIHKCISRANIA